MLISSAAAANSSILQGESPIMSFLPLILIFLVFYFLIIRPQLQKSKQHQQLVSNLKIGDKIITSSGIFGVIKEIDGKEAVVEIANDTKIRILKSYIAEVETDNLPAKKNDKKKHRHA